MKKKEFTLKDLMVSFDTPSFHEGFGMTDKRGKEIISEIEKTMFEMKNWEAAGLFKKLTEKNIAKNAREVALVTLLVGCHVGERMLLQTLKGNAELALRVLNRKETEHYDN